MSLLSAIYNSLPQWLRNRYVLSGLAFFFWILLFDSNSLLSQMRMRSQVKEMLIKEAFYQREIQQSNRELKELLTNNATLEKFAREHYLMKRPNEDVFIIVEEE
ncbi:septum formation initiator [Sphingobacteriales bacterium UPWRP_1]|nr:hypothetical protein BVG80_10790 [Sphingobacteriales bacterium TSM_CSM]PSJ77407.1 septum formation initiator [Sphingobacteriales bacterium UPWRP_1]